MMTVSVKIENCSYSVGDKTILDSLNLEVAEGQYFAIAGVNGAGKSTMIKLLIDLIRPSGSATIEIFGLDNKKKISRENLVYLPEKFNLSGAVTELAIFVICRINVFSITR